MTLQRAGPMTVPLVLVVDGDPDTRRILRAAFEHHGYRVLDAATAAEGLRLALEHVPAAIVGDFPSPVGEGTRFPQVLRVNTSFAGTPILAVTARVTVESLAEASEAADEVLVKPVRPRVVVAAVSRLLGRGPV